MWQIWPFHENITFKSFGLLTKWTSPLVCCFFATESFIALLVETHKLTCNTNALVFTKGYHLLMSNDIGIFHFYFIKAVTRFYTFFIIKNDKPKRIYQTTFHRGWNVIIKYFVRSYALKSIFQSLQILSQNTLGLLFT